MGILYSMFHRAIYWQLNRATNYSTTGNFVYLRRKTGRTSQSLIEYVVIHNSKIKRRFSPLISFVYYKKKTPAY